MSELKNITNYQPYDLKKEPKKKLFKDFFTKLTFLHYTKCKEYKKIIKNLKFEISNKKNELKDFPIFLQSFFYSHLLIQMF